MAKAVDILVCALWLAILYPFGLASKPSGREMISSYIGEADYAGRRWARLAAKIIDRLAILCGDDPGHCARSYLKYRFLDD